MSGCSVRFGGGGVEALVGGGDGICCGLGVARGWDVVEVVCFGVAADVGGGGVVDISMAFLISSSYSLHAFAEAFSVARSFVDNWSMMSLDGIGEGEMSVHIVGGGGGCVCCGGGFGGGWCGGVVVCGVVVGGVGGGVLALGVLGVCGVLVGWVVGLVVAVCGGVVCCVLGLLGVGVSVLWSSFFCRWCLGFFACLGGLFVLAFPCGSLPCGDLRENL